MIVMAPKDENELQHMLHSALAYRHPVAIRFPKGKATGNPMDETYKTIPLGRSEILKEGKNLIFAYGSMVYPCLEAAERLEKEGFDLAVVNARFVKPLDEDVILHFSQPGSVIITVEEAILAGGFGSAVREFLDNKQKFHVKFKSIGIPLEIYPHGSSDQIKNLYKLDAEGLVAQIKSFLQEKEEPLID
jgi:1-deoxy-D-xylulose-5-phosphate synthase